MSGELSLRVDRQLSHRVVVLSAGHRWTNVSGNDLLNVNVPTSTAETDRIWRFVVTNLNAFGAELSYTLVCALAP